MFSKQTYIDRRARLAKEVGGGVLLFLLFSLFISCSRESSFQASPSGNISNNVSLQDVYIYLQGVKGLTPTRSAETGIEPVCDRSDTLLFIVNYEKGWEILTADKRAPRVVAFSESGSFSYEDLASNPAVKAFYDGVMDQIRFLKKNPDYHPERIFDDWNDLRQITEHESWILIGTETTEIEQLQNHLTVTRWGQGSPWNIRAPFTSPSHAEHCLTGCAPVAAAQMLYYLHYYYNVPEKAYGDCVNNKHILPGADSLILQYSDVSFPSSTYSSIIWDNMPLTQADSSFFCRSVSSLMVRLGIIFKSRYRSDRTSTYMTDIRVGFSDSLHINHLYSTGYSADLIFENIYTEMPCILGITRYTTNPDGTLKPHGHVILADACKRNIQRITRRYVWNSLVYGPQYKTEVTDTVISTFFGFNWGWGNTGMTSGGSTIWYNAQTVSWTAGARTYTEVHAVLSDFYPDGDE